MNIYIHNYVFIVYIYIIVIINWAKVKRWLDVDGLLSQNSVPTRSPAARPSSQSPPSNAWWIGQLSPSTATKVRNCAGNAGRTCLGRLKLEPVEHLLGTLQALWLKSLEYKNKKYKPWEGIWAAWPPSLFNSRPSNTFNIIYLEQYLWQTPTPSFHEAS